MFTFYVAYYIRLNFYWNRATKKSFFSFFSSFLIRIWSKNMMNAFYEIVAFILLLLSAIKFIHFKIRYCLFFFNLMFRLSFKEDYFVWIHLSVSFWLYLHLKNRIDNQQQKRNETIKIKMWKKKTIMTAAKEN